MRRSSLRRSPLLASALSALLSASCAPVDTLPGGLCGNGVVEAGEDCDTHPRNGHACVQPGEAWQCSYVCDEGQCPAGYGCGTDDVCRKPTGQIAASHFAEASSQARELLAGDFDDDRRDDVVGVEPGRTRVYFLGASGDVQQVSFSALLRPAIGKLGPLATDRTDDLTQSLNVGIGVSISEGDRTFEAKTFGSISIGLPADSPFMVSDALPMAFDALPTTKDGQLTGDETGALIAQQDAKTGELASYGIFVNFGGGASGPVLWIPDGRPENLGGPPVAGNFDKSDDCHELVFAIKANLPEVAPALRIYKPCEKGDNGYVWRGGKGPLDGLLGQVETIAPINGPAFSFDVNGDGRLDLLVSVKLGAVSGLEVAYGVGDGSFHSQTPPPAPSWPVPAGDNESALYVKMPGADPPLALGDIDGDGQMDVVESTHVLLGKVQMGIPIFQAIYQSPRTWTEAVITDMNGDGKADVVASAAGAPNIDVLTGNSTKFLNPLQISTDGTVSLLAAGDFDGDLVNDIAFQDALSAQESRFMIAFGRTAGGPEEPAEIGSFDSPISHIVRGHVHAFGADNITDLGVARKPPDGAIELSFFPGDGNRVVQSPFLLTEPNGIVHAPLLTALGALKERPTDGELHNDTAVLAIHRPPPPDPDDTPAVTFANLTNALRLWGLTGTGDADFDTTASSYCTMPSGAVFLPGLDQASAIVVSSAAAGKAGRTFVATPRATLSGNDISGIEIGSILVEALFHPGGQCEIAGAGDPPFAGDGKILFRVRTAHLDGDDQPEILALLRTYEPGQLVSQLGGLGQPGGNPASPASSQLVVFWNGVPGEGATLSPYVPGGQPGLVDDYAVDDIDGDGSPEVVAVGDSAPVLYEVGPDGASLVPVRTLGIDGAGADTVLFADADGDGVKDLVVGRGGLRFFRGIPRAEVVDEPAATER